MTKKEMIEKMQEREREADKKLKYWSARHGYESEKTDRYLWAWAEIFELMTELGIETKRGEA